MRAQIKLSSELQSQETLARETRERLAQALHDGVAQILYSVEHQLEACRKRVHQKPEYVEKKLAQLEKIVNQGLKDIYQLIYGLRESRLWTVPLSTAVQEYADQFYRANNLTGKCHITGTERTLAPLAESDLYYIVCEALSNAARHGQADEVTVKLRFGRTELELSVEDNGQGFNAAERLSGAGNSSGLGLKNIATRAARLGGRCQILSSPGAATKIIVEVPYEDNILDLRM